MTWYKQRAPEDPEATVQSYAQSIYDLDPEFLTALFDNWLENDYQTEQLFSQLVCPTLLVYGELTLGGIVSNDDAEQLKKQVPLALTVQIKGADHGVIYGPAGQFALAEIT